MPAPHAANGSASRGATNQIFEWVDPVWQNSLDWLQDSANEGIIAVLIFLLPLAWAVARGQVALRRRRVSVPLTLAGAGAQPLFGGLHTYKMRRRAAARRRITIRDFLRAEATPDLLDAALLGLPLPLRSYQTVACPRKGGSEVYCHRGEGLSTALSWLALRESRKRLVLLADWPTLRRAQIEGRELPYSKVAQVRPVRQKLVPPLIIIDNWPASGTVDATDTSAQYLRALNSAGYAYLLGVRLYRGDPFMEDHRQSETDAARLKKPTTEECSDLILRWQLLAEEFEDFRSKQLPEGWVKLNAKKHRRNIRVLLGLWGETLGFVGGRLRDMPILAEIGNDEEEQLLCAWLALSQCVEVLVRESVIVRAFPSRIPTLDTWVSRGLVRRDSLFGNSASENRQVGYHLANGHEAVRILQSLGRFDDRSVRHLLSDVLARQRACGSGASPETRVYWWTLFNFLVRSCEWPFEGWDFRTSVRDLYTSYHAELRPLDGDYSRTRIGASSTLARIGETRDARDILVSLIERPPEPRTAEERVGLWRALIDAHHVIPDFAYLDSCVRYAEWLCRDRSALPVRTLARIFHGSAVRGGDRRFVTV